MIDLLPSSEQQQIIDSVAEFLAGAMPIERLRPGESEPQAVLEANWSAMAELGWFGIGLAEEHGGVGYTQIEEMLIARELGRRVISPAVVAGILAAHVAAEAGLSDLVNEIVAGSARVGLANRLSDSVTNGDVHLIDARGAALVLVQDETRLALYPRAAFGDAASVSSLDDAIVLERAKLPTAAPLAQSTALTRRAALLLAAQLLGVAEAARDIAVEYAKIRQQFGQPIGSFQALKHFCADMAARCEIGYAQVFYAGLIDLNSLPDADFQAAAATRLTRAGALENARVSIQIHGGIGFTSECDAHHYLKRSHLLGQLGGGARGLRERLLAGAAA